MMTTRTLSGCKLFAACAVTRLHNASRPAAQQTLLRCLSASHGLGSSVDSSVKNTKPELSREEQNWNCRVDLAAAFQLCAHLGYEEAIDNHLTLRAPSTHSNGDVLLINPYGLHWSQVTASSLIGADFKTGEVLEGHGDVMDTAFCIHREIHGARAGDGSNCVMHTHQPWATALATLKDPRLLMVHQNSTMFADRVTYYLDYNGIADLDDNLDEGARMAQAFKDKDVMLMGNHGLTAIGPTVAHAFNLLYFFEKACEIQIKAMSTGRDLNEFSEDIVQKMKATWPKYDYAIPLFFNSMKNVLIEKGSKFMT